MLASVLPGLRELRAPLAAGYLWLLLLWLAWGNEVPKASEAEPGPVERLYELEPVLSSLGIAVVASVAAYVIGSIAIDLSVVIGRFATGPGTELLRVLSVNLVGFVERRRHSWEGDQTGGSNWRARRRASEEREMMKVRLLDVSEPLHAEVDRPDAEASFRLALWPPISVLVIYAAWEIDPLWLLALPLPVALIVQWLTLRRRANAALDVAARVRREITSEKAAAEEARARRGG